MYLGSSLSLTHDLLNMIDRVHLLSFVFFFLCANKKLFFFGHCVYRNYANDCLIQVFLGNLLAIFKAYRMDSLIVYNTWRSIIHCFHSPYLYLQLLSDTVPKHLTQNNLYLLKINRTCFVSLFTWAYLNSLKSFSLHRWLIPALYDCLIHVIFDILL